MQNTTQIREKRQYHFFGAALFLRPILSSQEFTFLNLTAENMIEEARKNPQNWQCLLMKRNYLDYSWDHIGGNCEVNEFPMETMTREVYEEMGWRIKEAREVCRQWKNGCLEGFIYLAIPTEKNFMDDAPPRIPCDEVQTVAYFNLLDILKSDQFKANVKGRIKAFIEHATDFSLQ